MSLDVWLRGITIFVFGAAAGWIAAPDSSDPQSTTHSASSDVASPPSLSHASRHDSVELLADGSLSIHADGITLAWLESELARRGARIDTPQSGEEESDSGITSACDDRSPIPAEAPVDPARVVFALRNGSTQEGIAALTRSLEQNVDIPVDVLRETVEFGASSELRQLAFRMYVDAASSDTDSASAALTLGATSNDPNVRTDALARLAEFEQMRQATVTQGSE